MIITIDCRWIGSSGVGAYIDGCLPFLLDSANYFILLGDQVKLKETVTGRKNARILDCPFKPFSVKDQFFFPKNLLSEINKSDLYYSPFFNIPSGITIPVYTTIHDIIFPDMPYLSTRTGLMMRMAFYRRAFSRSKVIFTVSDFSKSRIEHYSHAKIPVTVTYSALSPEILQFKKPETKDKTIIFIGNIKKHKGLDCLLDAFLLARAEGLSYKLVIIGNKENFRTADESITQKIISVDSDVIEFTGFLSDEELREYLSHAALLVQPSLYEGFGLPPLEAMALGTNALISDIPALKEIYSDFPVTYFKAGDSGDLKDKMMEILHNKQPSSLVLRDELLYKYTFEKTAGIILRELQ